jgi:hypothetical protein
LPAPGRGTTNVEVLERYNTAPPTGAGQAAYLFARSRIGRRPYYHFALEPPTRETPGAAGLGHLGRDEAERGLHLRLRCEAAARGSDWGPALYESATQAGWFDGVPVRRHLIGHSAGAIVHCFIVHRLAWLGWTFESVNFMAPAVTVELFKKTLAPRVKDGTVKQLRSFHLADAAEEQDPTCRPVLGYGRSLLYLVSESFEGEIHTPILGMEKYFKAATDGLPHVKAWTAPGPASDSTTHGGFDDDGRTMKCIIDLIKKRVA